MIEANPLSWPSGRHRSQFRVISRFGSGKSNLTTGRAINELNDALKRLRAKSVVISSNVRTKQDGTLYASAREPDDPGVCVYFEYKGKQKAFSCDKYTKLKDNIWAIAKTIEAIRGIDRWGTGDMVDAAFSGFDALPSPEMVSRKLWHEVLLVDETDPHSVVQEKYRKLASVHHPDRGPGRNTRGSAPHEFG